VRRVVVRSLAVLLVGLAALAGILYYASTVDGRAPLVERIALTQHLSTDESVALTTTSIEVTFSEVVDHATAEVAFRIDPEVAGAFSWSGAVVVFTPAERLPLETEFSVRVDPGVRDEAGNEMADGSSALAFTTVGHPGIASSQPAQGEAGVALEEPLVLTFTTLMDTASVESALQIIPGLAYEASWSGEELTLTPTHPLQEDRAYTLRIGTDARDAEGIPLGEPYELRFTTARTSLQVETLFPADETVGISPSTPVAMVFDRELADDDAGDRFSIEPEVAGSLEVRELPGAAGIERPGLVALVFDPSGTLEPNTTYTVSLAAGVAASDGSRLAAEVSWRFTTGAPPATLSNLVAFISDRAGIDNLWTMNPDGTGQRQLSAELSPVVSYAVAPNGRLLVVGDGARIVQLRPDGSDRTVLTPDDVLEFDPAYAPDGSALAFGRTDAQTGAGLGIWLRSPDGGDATAVELPAGAGPTPAPTDGAGAPVLRAPRFSPDGTALAFVDVTNGRVGLLELGERELVSVRWAATSPPAWLPDSSAMLLGGLVEPLHVATEAGPLPALDPATLGMDAIRLASQDVALLERGAASVSPLHLEAGAARPAAGGGGRFLFVTVQPGTAGIGGELWYAARRGVTPRHLLDDGGSPVISASFGLEADTVLAVRRAEDDALPREDAGIWLLDLAGGDGEQLSEDGWLPRWLP
jgi:hypothetical protein